MIERMRERADFLATASGRRFHTKCLTLQARKPSTSSDESADPAQVRLGFTVTKKCGHATERNRIKRRLREAARQSETVLAELATDLVIVGRRDVLAVPFPQLIDDMTRAARAVARGPRREAAAKPGDRAPTALRGTSATT